MKKSILIFSVILLCAAAVSGVYQLWSSQGKQASDAVHVVPVEQAAPAATSFPYAKAERIKPAPELVFDDINGHQVHLSDWKGRVVLLNLWASWCVPCRTEMPGLARLQKALGSKDFEVLAVSLDHGGPKVPQDFLESVGATALTLYTDPTGKSMKMFQIPGLPSTMLIDRKGMIVGGVLGPAEWDSPQAHALIESTLKQ